MDHCVTVHRMWAHILVLHCAVGVLPPEQNHRHKQSAKAFNNCSVNNDLNWLRKPPSAAALMFCLSFAISNFHDIDFFLCADKK